MAEIILQPRLDTESLTEQLKKAEQEQVKEAEKLFQKQKLTLDVVNKKLTVERNINKLYQDRLRLIDQMNARETSMLNRLMTRGRLGVNAVQSAIAAGQYQQTLQKNNGLTTYGALTADIIGSAVVGSVIASGMNANGNGNLPTPTFGTNPYRGTAFKKNVMNYIGNSKVLGPLASNMGSLFQKLSPYKGLGGSLAFGSLAASAFSQAEQTYNGAREIGMNTDKYQRYSEGFKRSGAGSMNEIYGAFQGARTKALAGDATARVAFNQMGVTDLSSASQSFDKLIESMKNFKPTTDNSRAALEIFGDSANKLVNNMSKFKAVFDSMNTMPESVVKSLVYVKDTFTTAMKEVVTGIGYLIAALNPLAIMANRIRAGLAYASAYAGYMSTPPTEQDKKYQYDDYVRALHGQGPAKHEGYKSQQERALEVAQKAYNDVINASVTPTPEPFKTDVNTTAGLKPVFMEPMHLHLNRLQQQGMFVGGSPISMAGALVRDPISYLKRIAKATETSANKGRQ